MKTSIKILAFLTLFLLIDCSKKDTNEIIDPDPVEVVNVIIASENINLKDAQIGIVTVENYTLDRETYNAKFSDIDIILTKTNSLELSFVVPPNIETGTYKLSLDFASNSLDFKITKTVLTTTPEEVVIGFVGNYEDEINETIALFTQGNVPQELLNVKENIDKAIIDINNLSDNDKIIAAKFIENNVTNLNKLKTELNQESLIFSGKSVKKDCDTPKCYFAYGSKVLLAAALVEVGGTVAIIGAGIIGIDAIVSLIRGKQSVLVTKVKKVVGEGLSIAYFAQNYLAETTFDFAENEILNFKTSSSKSNKIDNKTTISFKIKPTYRTLNASDASSSDDTIKTFVAAYIKFKAFWDTNFASSLGAFPTFNTDEEQKEATELSQFNLEISGDSENVEASEISGTATSFSSTFTNKTDVDQDFSVNITYTDGDISASTSVSFKIGFDEIFLKEVSGNNQTGIQAKELEKPIVVKVEDAEGNAIKDVDVQFNITKGEGTLSSSTTKTNDEGFAEVSWTLGDNLDDQSLEAIVKNSAGENISTSPITFTATSKELELHLEKFSGDNQTGEKNEVLAEPLVVKVVDDAGNPIQNINIEFNVASGNGSLSTSSTTTNSNGNAEVNWTLGDDLDNQSVEVIVKKSDGTNIDGSPLTFIASIVKSCDEIEDVKNQIVGKWSVNIITEEAKNDPDNYPWYDLEMFADGTGEYSIDGKVYSMTWTISCSNGKFQFSDYGFWHRGGYGNEISFPLILPITEIITESKFTAGQQSRKFIKQ